MAVIIKDKEKLSERCIEINVTDNQEKLKEISDAMLDIFHSDESVVSLAANQLGYSDRVIGIRFSDGIKFFVNPMFMKQEGIHVSVESNPSVEGNFLVPRSDYLEMAYQDLFGLAGSVSFTDSIGDIVQQTVQMLDGLSIDDPGFGLQVYDDFMNASDEEKQEVINMYLDSIKESYANLNEDIESDPELKKISDATKFLIAGAKGEIELIKPEISNRKKRKLAKIEKAIKNFGHKFTKKKKKK